MKTILETLANGEHLSAEQAGRAFAMLMRGEMSPAQAGAFLMGLRAKGETAEELFAAVDACLEKARLVPGMEEDRIDIVGTGGDCRNSFNCSTATALVLASMGYRVVKHGNRAVSSSCGSADIVERLGLPLTLGPEDIRGELEARNFAFLFAPNFHPAFRHVVPVRKDMGIRTLFNMMGPLLNPARPTHMLLGVAREEMMGLMAEVLRRADVKRAIVVHGAEGFDELTPFGPNRVLFVRAGNIEEGTVDPAPLGLVGGRPEDVAVTEPDHSLAVMRELLDGQGPVVMQNMLILNVAAAVMLLDGTDIFEAAHKAREAVFSGKAARMFAGGTDA